MKTKRLFLFGIALLVSACASTARFVTKDVAVNATLIPLEITDSATETYSVVSNGVFSEVWESYFGSSFNPESQQQMTLEVVLLRVDIQEKTATIYENIRNPGDRIRDTGETESSTAIVQVQVSAAYEGKQFKDTFEVTATKKKEKQTSGYGGSSSVFDTMDPEQIRLELIKEAIQKSVIEADKALTAFMGVARS